MVKFLGGYMKNKYFIVKGRYFWNCFYRDAVIVHYVTGYVLHNNKLGFPSKVLNKVLEKISALNINYILVYELDDIVKYEYTSNSYTFYLEECMSLYKKFWK